MSIGEQLLRHRSFTFQKISGRYEELTEFEPIELRREHPTNRQSSTEVFDPILEGSYPDWFKGNTIPVPASSEIDSVLRIIKHLYQELLESGVAKECARFILPACTKTTMLMTGNLRSWIHFLDVRDDSHAQKEAQEIAQEIKNQLLTIFPTIFKARENAQETSNNSSI